MSDSMENVTCPEGAMPVVSGLSKFRNCEELSDYTVKCGQAQWPVHRIVLALHSSVLARACLGDFKESRQGFVDLSDDPPECVEALIYYLYNFEYHARVDDVDDQSVEPKFHVAMAVIADKYDILALKKQAIEKCKHSLHGNCDPDIFADTAAAAYESALALKELCEYIVDFAIDHKDVGVGGSIHPSFEKAIRSCPDLSVDIIRRLITRRIQLQSFQLPVGTQYNCPQCYKVDNLFLAAPSDKYRCRHCYQYSYGTRWLVGGRRGGS